MSAADATRDTPRFRSEWMMLHIMAGFVSTFIAFMAGYGGVLLHNVDQERALATSREKEESCHRSWSKESSQRVALAYENEVLTEANHALQAWQDARTIKSCFHLGDGEQAIIKALGPPTSAYFNVGDGRHDKNKHFDFRVLDYSTYNDHIKHEIYLRADGGAYSYLNMGDDVCQDNKP